MWLFNGLLIEIKALVSSRLHRQELWCLPGMKQIGGVSQQHNCPYRADISHFICTPIVSVAKLKIYTVSNKLVNVPTMGLNRG